MIHSIFVSMKNLIIFLIINNSNNFTIEQFIFFYVNFSDAAPNIAISFTPTLRAPKFYIKLKFLIQ